MINKKIFFSLLLLAAGFLSAAAQKSPQDMDRFIDALMKKTRSRVSLPAYQSSVSGVPVVCPVSVRHRNMHSCPPEKRQSFSMDSIDALL